MIPSSSGLLAARLRGGHNVPHQVAARMLSFNFITGRPRCYSALLPARVVLLETLSPLLLAVVLPCLLGGAATAPIKRPRPWPAPRIHDIRRAARKRATAAVRARRARPKRGAVGSALAARTPIGSRTHIPAVRAGSGRPPPPRASPTRAPPTRAPSRGCAGRAGLPLAELQFFRAGRLIEMRRSWSERTAGEGGGGFSEVAHREISPEGKG